MATSDPTLADVITNIVLGAVLDLRVSGPAQVTAYDSSKQCVSVQPLIKDPFIDEEEKRQSEPLPIITGVPLLFLGGGGYRTTYPVMEGDTVLLIHSDSSIDEWVTNGGVADPKDERRHSLSDAFAISGLRDFNNALGDAPIDRMSIGKDDGAQITIRQDEIRIGSDSAGELAGLHSDDDKLRLALEPWANSPPLLPAADIAALKLILKTLIATGWPVGAKDVKVQ